MTKPKKKYKYVLQEDGKYKPVLVNDEFPDKVFTDKKFKDESKDKEEE